jgi:predicted dehydrogenase
MEKKTVRTGIVGSGFSAGFHFEALHKIYGTNVEVVGVHTIDTEGGKQYARQRDVRFFDSLDPLLDEVDVIHVCTPPSAHEVISVAGLSRDKFVICEKPLTGYFGDGSDAFRGDRFSKQDALDAALASVERILEAERRSQGRLLYAENWVYMPSIQKEREILEKTGGQILWIHGEEAHSGSHAEYYGHWKHGGGGVLIGKGCHPLTAALYLKRVEGRTRDGNPIRPKTVSARTHAVTRLPGFRDEGHIRCDYHDIDDFSAMHVEFEDGTIADVFASDIVVGGIHNWLEIFLPTTTAPIATSTRTRQWKRTTRSRRISRTSTSSRRSKRSKAGPARRPTRIGSPAIRRRWKPSIGPSLTPNRFKAIACWPPTRSPRSTPPTCRPSGRERRSTCAYTKHHAAARGFARNPKEPP